MRSVLLLGLLAACSAATPALEADPPAPGATFVVTVENDTEDAVRVYAAFDRDLTVPLGDVQSQRARSFTVDLENELFRVGIRSATRTREPIRWSETIQPFAGDSLFLRWFGGWPTAGR